MLGNRCLGFPRALALAALLSSTLAASCGGGGGDQTKSFVGPWTFASGALVPMCGAIQGVPTFNLAGLNVTFAKLDDSTISLMLGSGCAVKFHVSGSMASAASGETCTLDVGPPLGQTSIAITKWTLALTGEHIDAMIAGTAFPCTATGTAVLVRGTTDAGVRDGAPHDTTGDTVGGSDAPPAQDAADGGAPEASASETGSSDAAPEVGFEAGAETAADAPAGEASGDAPGAETD
jgi:hypothetical protein